VYGIVKQHQGWIEVQSRPNAGTTMRVFIPAIPQTVGGAVPEPVGATAIRGGSETILVVEDEPILLGMIKLVLENLGYRVIAASNGAEAIELWRTQKDNVELLLTDLVMPGGISGKELAELLRAEKPGLKVIYSSGYSMDMSGRELVEAAGSRFLSKPYDPARLGEVVRECLDAKV
jgi:CheY-like chemotaxis protein